MRINYKILWIDDDEGLVKLYEPSIKEYLDSLGFNLVLNYLEDGDDVSKLPESDFDYDLILLDYNLGDEKKTGEEIIKKIQSDDFTIETLFYSSQPGFHDLINKSGGLQRTSFCEGKEYLEDKIKKVINLSIRKVQDVSNMRGLVIAEAIDIESKMERILCNFFKICTDKNISKSVIKKTIESHKELSKKRYDELKKYSPEEIIDFIEADFFTHHAKRKTIRDLLTEKIKELKSEGNRIKLDEVEKLKKEVDNMYKEVIGIRNLMAHAKEEKNSSNTPVLVSPRTEVEIDQTSCVRMREDLKKHDNNLDTISEHLNGK